MFYDTSEGFLMYYFGLKVERIVEVTKITINEMTRAIANVML